MHARQIAYLGHVNDDLGRELRRETVTENVFTHGPLLAQLVELPSLAQLAQRATLARLARLNALAPLASYLPLASPAERTPDALLRPYLYHGSIIDP